MQILCKLFKLQNDINVLLAKFVLTIYDQLRFDLKCPIKMKSEKVVD